MAQYEFKRDVKDLKRSRVMLFGPISADGELPDRVGQRLLFDRGGGTIGLVSLIEGATYAAVIELMGEKKGSITASIKPVGADEESSKIFSIAIPTDHDGARGALGFTYVTVLFFQVSE